MNSYYELPLLKKPVWTWEVPAYFAIGGAAGVAAMIGVASRDARLTRDARRMAAIGAVVSGPLLIADLGRPERFIYMLRVFKPQSPMSVGAWILTAFGATSTAAAILPGALADIAAVGSAASGLGMATYTGVLLGATSIPVWAKHAGVVPAHFGASATSAAIAALELRGHRSAALNNIGIVAAAVETAMGARVELTHDRESAPLRTPLTRIGGVLSGPVPLLLRLFGARSNKTRRLAAASAIAGSLLTRMAWIAAGRESARLSGRDTSGRRDAVGERARAGQHSDREPDTRRQQ